VEEPLAEGAAVAEEEAVVAAEAASESHLVDVEEAEGAAVAVEEDAEEPEAVEPKLSSSRTDTVAFSLPRERNTF